MNYIPSYINDRINNVISLAEDDFNKKCEAGEKNNITDMIHFISIMSYSIDKKKNKIENILATHNKAMMYTTEKKIQEAVKNNIFNFINEANTYNKNKNVKRPKRPKIAHVITNRKIYFTKWISKLEVDTLDISKKDLILFCNNVIKPFYDTINVNYDIITYIHLKKTIKDICKNDKKARIIPNIYDFTTPLLMILKLLFYFETLDNEFESLDYIASNEKYYPSLLKFLIKRYLSHVKEGTIFEIYPYLPEPSSAEQKSMFNKLLTNQGK